MSLDPRIEADVLERLHRHGGLVPPGALAALAVCPGGTNSELLVERLGLNGRWGGDVLTIETTDRGHAEAGLDVCRTVFGQVYPADQVIPEILAADPDFSISEIARIGDRVVGAYFLSRRLCPMVEAALNDHGFRKPDGTPVTAVEGEALAILPGWRGLGIGRWWRSMPAARGLADYTWGTQMKSLENGDHWLRRRVLVADMPGVIVTAEAISPSLKPIFIALFGNNQPRPRSAVEILPLNPALPEDEMGGGVRP